MQSTPTGSAVHGSSARSLRKNISWTTTGNIIYAACQWGTVTTVARIGTPAMVGQFALALAITAPVMQFLSLNLRSIQATDAKQDFSFRDYFSVRSVAVVVALVVCAAIALLYEGLTTTAVVIVIVAIAKVVDGLSDVYFGLFQQNESMRLVSQPMIMNGILSLVLMIVGLKFSGDIVVGTIGYALGSLIPMVILVIPAAKSLVSPSFPIGFRFTKTERHRHWSLVTLAFPLGLSMMLNSLTTNVPRYFIEAEGGEYSLGIFAAVSYFIVAGGTVVIALGQAISPKLSQHFAANRLDEFSRLLGTMVGVGILLGVAGAILSVFLGDQLLSLFYSREYADHAETLVVLSVAAAFSFAASFTGFGMTAMRRFAAQVPVALLVLAVSIIASAVLIPTHGILGAALAVLTSSIVLFLAMGSVVVYTLLQCQNQSEYRSKGL